MVNIGQKDRAEKEFECNVCDALTISQNSAALGKKNEVQ